MKLTLFFGALSPLVSEQIKQQLGYSDDKIIGFNKDAEALVRVYIKGIITDSENVKARKRLMKNITNYLDSISKQ